MKFCQVSILTACFAVASNGKKDGGGGGVTENYDYNGDELASMERMIWRIPNDSSEYDVTTTEKHPVTIVLPSGNSQGYNDSTLDSYWDMSSGHSNDCPRSSGSSVSSSNDTSGMYISEKFSTESGSDDQYDIESYEMVTDRRGQVHLQNRILQLNNEGNTSDVNAIVGDSDKRSNVRTKDAAEKVGNTKSKPMTKTVGQRCQGHRYGARAPYGRRLAKIETTTAPGRSYGFRKLRTISVRVKV